MTTFNSRYHSGRWEELQDFYQLNNKNMQINNNFWTSIKSAIVSGIITGVLGIAGYIIGVGSVFNLDLHSLVDVAALSALTTVVSLLKAGLTSDSGNIAGTSIRIK